MTAADIASSSASLFDLNCGISLCGDDIAFAQKLAVDGVSDDVADLLRKIVGARVSDDLELIALLPEDMRSANRAVAAAIGCDASRFADDGYEPITPAVAVMVELFDLKAETLDHAEAPGFRA